jgi:hypothetical protein
MVGTREGSVLIAEEVTQWKIYSEQVPNSAPFRGQVLITEKEGNLFVLGDDAEQKRQDAKQGDGERDPLSRSEAHRSCINKHR